MIFSNIVTFALAGSLVAAAPAKELDSLLGTLGNALLVPYAPKSTSCPSTPLIRSASSGLNPSEAKYIESRKSKADVALAAWLQKFGCFNTSNLPVVALTASGGGLRALLEGAGVMQGFDGRDGPASVGGLYQGLTYQGGLSGGSWMLSSVVGNNWPTITWLKENLWKPAFQASLLLPAKLLSVSGLTEYEEITKDVVSKQTAGYETTIVDPYGRLLGYSLLESDDGGVSTRFSGVPVFSNFTSFQVPYPIITAVGVNGSQGQCLPTTASNQYEFGPYEYGSWDSGIAAFADTQYMGSALSNGQPITPNKCTVYYDSLSYVFGTSSDVFFDVCAVIAPENSTLANTLEGIVQKAHVPVYDDLFALYPNPFFNSSSSPVVSQDKDLTLIDGGVSGQNVPIWPFIQPQRPIDVLIASDNSNDVNGFPDGSEIHQTYLNAKAAGLTRMPFIPEPAVFASEGLLDRASFFGCNASNTVFIVYLPNTDYVYPSNQSTFKLQYNESETEGMIDNGVAIATQNGTEGWPFCLACAVANKAASLPDGCNACFDKYCYRQ